MVSPNAARVSRNESECNNFAESNDDEVGKKGKLGFGDESVERARMGARLGRI